MHDPTSACQLPMADLSAKLTELVVIMLVGVGHSA
jgi:hypothetical protein